MRSVGSCLAAPNRPTMRLALITLWFLIATLCSGGHALAHAALVESHPADGMVLEQAPSMVRLRFNEPVSPLVVSLTDSQGGMHRNLTAAGHDETLDITLPPNLPRGSQILSFRVTSGDGHPIGGSITFSIGASTEPGATLRTESSRGVRSALWLVRMALHLGLFVGVGGVFFLAWVAPDLPARKTERMLTGFLVTGALAALLSLGLQGLDALGQPFAVLGTPAAWMAGWRTSFGLTVAAALASLLLACIGLRTRTPWRRSCSLAALAGAGLALALSGHASAASPQWLTRSAVFLHVIGVAYWVGALVPLALAVRQAPMQALPVVRRFSNAALVAVAVLTVAGLALAAVQVQTPANLTGTAYGWVLIVKTGLVIGLLGLAAVNRLWLTPRLTVPDGSGGRRLIQSVTAEIVLATAILAAVGLWRFTPPPRSLVPAVASASVHLHTPNLMAQVTLSPGRAGANRARIVIASGRAEPVEPKEVTLILAKPDAGIEALERQAQREGRKGWKADNLVLPLAGSWQVRVDILVTDFEKTSLEGSITIGP